MKSTLPLPIIEELRMRLECDRDRLMEQIAGLRAAEGANRPQKSVTWGKEVTDQADQGMDQAEWDRLHIEELALADRLAEVAHALAKIPLGAYGVCEACGQPIPEARLQELPAARFDLEHEVAFESRIHAQEQLPEPGF